ncbi:MAG: carboxypeptidase regulatory-like domain-containing protein, partial [Betaproteobacteria bacterium]
AAALLVFPLVASAQDATITGTITDATGGVLPGVTVTAVNDASGNTYEAVTDAKGVFRMPARIGTYRITATLTGFGDASRPAVPVAVGQVVTINLQMAPSGVQESVTVTGEAPLIDVSTSSLGSNISQAQMSELPVNGRNWEDLGMLAVGNKVNDVSGPGIAAVGAGTYQVNVDGQQITYEGGALGNVQARISRDAIAEFEFISNRFDATQGRSSGIQINAVTRGGTNTPSGLFGAYFRDSKFNAEDPVLHTVLPYSDQQISFAYGGPIIKDKLHYFANYEFEREPRTFTWNTPYPAFNLSFTAPRKENKGGGRLDYQFSPSTSASFRSTIWKEFQPEDNDFPPAPTRHTSRLTQVTRHSNNELFTLTKVLGTRAVNEFKGGYAFVDNEEVNRVPWKNHPAAASSGITNGSPIINFSGFTVGPDGSIPQIIKQHGQQVRTPRHEGRWGIHQELLAAHDLPHLLGHLRCAGGWCTDSDSGGDAGDIPGLERSRHLELQRIQRQHHAVPGRSRQFQFRRRSARVRRLAPGRLEDLPEDDAQPRDTLRRGSECLRREIRPRAVAGR